MKINYGIIISSMVMMFFLYRPTVLLAQEECLECHNDPELVTENDAGEEVLLHVDPEIFANSIHGEFDCTDCHGDVDIEEHPGDPAAKVDCAMCHEDAVEDLATSVHAPDDSHPDAATCIDCHGTHDILPSSAANSKTNLLNIAATCATCHADPKITKKYNIKIQDPLASYQKSVHGVVLMSNRNYDAATCTSCHGSHSIKRMTDPTSEIFWKNVPETCGQCHGEIYAEFAESVHGKAVERGERYSPVCTDCHGEHGVKKINDPTSPVHPLKVSHDTCERCHGSEKINEQYGLAKGRKETFENSFHGLAVKGGSLSAANCASCHGIHNILPSSDPASLIHPSNLKATCEKCHDDLGENLANSPVHLTTSTTPGRIVQLAENIYIWLIILVIGGMILHNTADFIRRSKNKLSLRDK